MTEFDQNLQEILKGLKSNYGSDFFDSLTLQLNKIIEADYTFIAKLDRVKYVSQTISLVAHNEIVDNFEYSLESTPCADVSNEEVCIYPENICQIYPKDQLLIDMKVEGYIGTPLYNSQGKVMGLVVALYEQKIEKPDMIYSLFELFSGRISAEIEREEKEQQLIELNKRLESKVEERTAELSSALDKLTKTQESLIEKEKMASLGSLVAGVAHEINTPLGIAILSSSTLGETIVDLSKKIDGNSLTKSELVRGFGVLKESEECLIYNLQRAADLVSNFKQVAIDRNTKEISKIDCQQWFNTLISSLRPMLKQKNIEISVELIGDNFSVNTYPAYLSQIITNFVSNSEIHAFDLNDKILKHEIIITIDNKNNKLNITFSDNGKGMNKEIKAQIFDPFFTTRRGQGGTGLGLSIVKNLIQNTMEGKLTLNSESDKGTTFNITLPSI